MKRRKFLKKSAVAASLVTIPGTLLPLTACNENPQKFSRGVKPKEIRSPGYLQRVKSQRILPKSPISLRTYRTSSGVQASVDVQILPMPLAERIRQKIVPKRGFCSLAPGGDALLSGNGTINIEVAGNPYTERIPFTHESLFAPRVKSSETAKIANVFPKVRQMMLDGKYHEAILLAYNELKNLSDVG